MYSWLVCASCVRCSTIHDFVAVRTKKKSSTFSLLVYEWNFLDF